MTLQEPKSTGRFIKKSIVRSAVEEDCSTWDAQAGRAPRTTGRFVKASLTRPAITVDCSDWRETPTDRAEIPEPNNVAKEDIPQHESAPAFVEDSVNGVLVIHSTQSQLDELEGEQLAEMVRQRGANIILLNLSGVDFVSAPFLASLVKVRRQIQSVGGRFGVCNLGSQVQQVFSLLHLERMFWIYSNQHQALQTE